MLPLTRLLAGLLASAVLVAMPAREVAAGPQNSKALQREEQENYFRKWLNEDVIYIITEEERSVFQKLTTPEEKEQFIEQFWHRRDPDPRTATNEFKEEHYRRIAYANDHFFWSKPGWMTDRGRVYIIHGPPAEIESHPAGGPYDRRISEGGGTTVTYPFEIWRYRYIEGIGPDVEIEFVDPSMTREYRLALTPEEKDALLTTPGVGLTLAEESGEARRLDRPFFSHDARLNQGYPGMFQRAQDAPFERYKRYVNIQRPPQIKYKDLQEIVNTNVTYDNLSFQFRQDYIRLNGDQIIVPLTVQVANKDLSFEAAGTVHAARWAIYGRITTITGRILLEFEDEVRTPIDSRSLGKGLRRHSIYQKLFVLDEKTRYKVDLIIKDLASGKIGTKRQALNLPAFKAEQLASSSLVLSDYIQPLRNPPAEDQMFLLGDVHVRPSLNSIFAKDLGVGVYLQIYNAARDQTSLAPSLRVTYTILRKGEKAKEIVDERGESIHYYSAERIVLIRRLPVSDLVEGDYALEVKVEDLISGQQVRAEERFRLAEPATEFTRRP